MAVCRECGKHTGFPICSDCANEEEQRLLCSLSAIKERISKNRKILTEQFINQFRIPPLAIIIVISFLLLFVALFFALSNYADPLLQGFLYLMIPSLFILTIYLGWGAMSQDYVNKTFDLIDIKFNIRVLRRRTKAIQLLLRKPRQNWRKDDLLRLNFGTLEGQKI